MVLLMMLDSTLVICCKQFAADLLTNIFLSCMILEIRIAFSPHNLNHLLIFPETWLHFPHLQGNMNQGDA